MLVDQRVNPAFISSTWREPDDRISQRIDRLVAELKRCDDRLGYYFVIWSEFRDPRGGTQGIRAGRMHLSCEQYKKRLQRAMEWISYGLACMNVPAETLRFPAPKINA